MQVTGGRVWYRIVGDGPRTPLLLLHGGPGYPSDYLESLQLLADERPVIFYDQLGCGRSDRPNDRSLWTVERFVEELGQVRRALGLDTVHIMGHSWGTMLATDYMLGKPTGVASLILASPALSMKRWAADTQRMKAELPATTRAIIDQAEAEGSTQTDAYKAAIVEFFDRHYYRRQRPTDPVPREIRASGKGMNEDLYLAMWGTSEWAPDGLLKDYDRVDQLHEISVPTLFTAGRYDEADPASVALYQAQVKGSKLVVFEHSAHMAMIEETDRFVSVVRAFLHEHDAN
ncbi:MAG TPA: proline iminopeptidase-family hydrolase [Kofleriaceae bacterium]|nr:proline iminopeptidase-family hydrolase [Kofleriaceae bacterium]